MNHTSNQSATIFQSLSLIISCGNYDEGYKDGYKGSEKEKWILFGKTEYEDGYLNGEFDAWCNILRGTNYDEYEARCLKKFALKPKIEPKNENGSEVVE
jgi:hypothetical protein